MKLVSKRRRREAKTDYGKRLKLLKGERARVVLRKTNRYIIAQYVKSSEAQDSVQIGITSKKLLTLGWPKEMEGSLKSTGAAYLTGMLIGKKILEEDKKASPILDLGLYKNVHKSKLYAFAKGLVDVGVKVSHNAETFPDEKKIESSEKDVQKIIKQVKEKILKG